MQIEEIIEAINASRVVLSRHSTKEAAADNLVVVVVQPFVDVIAASSEPEPRYNAWGKPTTKKSISNAITRMQ